MPDPALELLRIERQLAAQRGGPDRSVIGNALSQIAAGALETASAVPEFGERALDLLGFSTPEEDTALGRTAERVRRYTRENLAPDPDLVGGVGGFFATTVPRALGSTVPIILTGGAGAAAGLSAGAATGLAALTGAAAGGGSFAQEAEDSGGTTGEQAGALGVGALLGATEALPFGRLFGRGARSATSRLAGAARQSAEEATQETVQGLGQNIYAGATFDEDRRVTQGLVEQALAGAIVGGALGGLAPPVQDAADLAAIRAGIQAAAEVAPAASLLTAREEAAREANDTVADETLSPADEISGTVAEPLEEAAQQQQRVAQDTDLSGAAGPDNGGAVGGDTVDSTDGDELTGTTPGAPAATDATDATDADAPVDPADVADIPQSLTGNDPPPPLSSEPGMKTPESPSDAGLLKNPAPPPPGDTDTQAPGGRQRGLARQMSQNESVESEIREASEQMRYDPVSNAQTRAEVAGKIEANVRALGFDQGIARMTAEALDFRNGMEPRIRVTFAVGLIAGMNGGVAKARARGNTAQAEALIDQTVQLTEQIAEYGTLLGQGTQAFRMFAQLLPDAHKRRFEEQRRRAAEQRGEQVQPLSLAESNEFDALVRKMREAKGDMLQADAARELMNFMTRKSGISLVDVGVSVWYANILSGLGTQGINIFGNAANLALYALQIAVTRPGSLGSFLRGARHGAKIGWQEAAAALAGRGSRQDKFSLETNQGRAQTLEAYYDPSLAVYHPRNIAAMGRFVMRALQAGDAFFYRTGFEGRAWALAAQMQQPGESGRLVGRSFREAVRKDLFGLPEKSAAAENQAIADLKAVGADLTRGNILRRQYEILTAQRDELITAQAQRFGEMSVFNQDPEGSLGAIAGGLDRIVRAMVVRTPHGDIPLAKPVVPFIRIVANVTSRQMDFTPVGIARGIMGRPLTGTTKRPYSKAEQRERLAAGIMGTAAWTLAYALSSSGDDDDNPYFQITANGPSSFRERSQLRNGGWRPFSIKIGDTYWAYNETPLAFMFGIIGGIKDAQRYDGLSELDSAGRSEFSLKLLGELLLENGFLSGVAGLFDVLEGRRSPGNYFQNIASGAVPARGLLSDVANITDPTLRDRESVGFFAGMMKDTPLMRSRLGRPMINVLGQPITRSGTDRVPLVRRFGGTASNDPVWRYLAANKLFITDPRYSGDITVTLPSPSRREQRLQRSALQRRKARVGDLAYGIMDEEEAYNYVRMSGQMIYAALAQRIQTPGFRQLPVVVQKDAIDEITRNARKAAKLRLLGAEFTGQGAAQQASN